MLWRGVTLVPAESILRVKGVDFLHDPVARDLGEDARGCNGKTEFVSPNDRSMRRGEIWNRKAIDQDVFGRRGQGADRLAHRAMSCPEDIDCIDGDYILDRYCPMHMRGAGDLHEQLRPEFWRQLLGIIQAAETAMLEENYRRGDDRPRERTAARFINTGDKENAPLLECALVPE